MKRIFQKILYNEKIENKKRESHIDLLKVIAILLVIIYHSTLYGNDIISEPTPINYIQYLFKTTLSPCVCLFFLANGYLLFNRDLNLKKHIYKTVHLIILCGIWGIGKILIFMPIKNEYLSLSQIIKDLLNWKMGWINSLWFLGALVCIYILFPILKVAYDKNKKIFYYFVSICTILTFGNTLLNEIGTIFCNVVLNKNITLQGYNFFNIFNPFRNICGYSFVYFCVGGCIYNYKEKILNINPLKRNLISLITLVISCLGLWAMGIYYSKISNEMWDVVWNGYDTIFTFINVICIYILCLNLNKDIGIIRLISCNTLGIYLIHEIIINLTIQHILSYPICCNIIFNIIYAIIVAIICLVISLILKKIPVVKKLVS